MSQGLLAEAPAAATLHRARRVLAERAGLAFDDRQDDALRDAVLHLAQRLDLAPDDAVRACERDDAALDVMVSRVLTCETHVFRTRPHFEALAEVVLPEILLRAAGARRLVVWSAGCSTGEETWSASLTVSDAADAARIDVSAWSVGIVGSDVSREALAQARRGEYGRYSFRGVTPLERARYFDAEGQQRWRVRDRFRRGVSFLRHDLVRDPLPDVVRGADLVLCRNVLMYFTPEAARRVVASLVEALAPGGWLLVGAAEHAIVDDPRLELHALPEAMLYRRSSGAARPERRVAIASAPRLARSAPAPAAVAVPVARAAPIDRDADIRRALESLESDPADVEACLVLGRTAADRGHAREAEAWLRRALHLRPRDAEACYLLALLLKDRDAQQSLALLADALEGDAGCVMALQLRGRLLHERGEARPAAAALQGALKLLAPLPDGAVVPLAHDLRAGQLRLVVGSLLGTMTRAKSRA